MKTLVLSATVLLCAMPMQPAEAAGKSMLLRGGISATVRATTLPSADSVFPDAAGLQIELAHQHTIGMHDIGVFEADRRAAEADYNRQLELYNEGITSRKALEDARSTYQKKEIDVMARRATMQINEAAIYAKHHRAPPFKTPVLTDAQVQSVLNATPEPPAPDLQQLENPQATQSHTYARMMP